jgi:coenzyme F420 biosynthesis associated uncharacterized protein
MSDSWIDWNAAASAAKRVSRPGPKVDSSEIRQAVADLHQCAERAIELVARESRLPVASHAPVFAVDRASIIDANVQNCRYMFAAAGVDEAFSGLTGRIASKASGTATGVGLAAITARVLGQFIPFGERPALYLVVPNIVKTERELGVAPLEFRLWVCLHEQTHQAQFGYAPWLSEYLIGVVASAVAAETDDEGSLAEQWDQLMALIGKGKSDGGKTGIDRLLEKAPPEVGEALGQATAVMSLLEGHADVMMDSVGPSVIPDLANIRAKFNERRGKGGWSAVVGKMVGMDAKLAQYKDGAAFARAVISERGIDVLNLAFEGPWNLPSLDELRNPSDWMLRVAPLPEPLLDPVEVVSDSEPLWILPATPAEPMPPISLPPLSEMPGVFNQDL